MISRALAIPNEFKDLTNQHRGIYLATAVVLSGGGNVFIYYVGLALRSWDRKLFVTALNIWMVSRFHMAHLQYSYAAVSGVIVLLLALLAVLWPALQAAKLSPGIATRGMYRVAVF